MTTILFKDNKFWIDGVEIINPEIMPQYTIIDSKGLDGDTFTLPENLSYHIEQYPTISAPALICLKLKEMKNEKLCPSCFLPKLGVNNTCPNTFHSLLKNETPEADKKEYEKTLNKFMEFLPGQSNASSKTVVENEKFKKALHKINDIRNSIIGYQKINWSAHIYPLVAALNEAGFEGDGYEKARLMAKTQLDRISDLEAQLVKAMETFKRCIILGKMNNTPHPSVNLCEVLREIESFISTNEVKG